MSRAPRRCVVYTSVGDVGRHLVRSRCVCWYCLVGFPPGLVCCSFCFRLFITWFHYTFSSLKLLTSLLWAFLMFEPVRAILSLVLSLSLSLTQLARLFLADADEKQYDKIEVLFSLNCRYRQQQWEHCGGHGKSSKSIVVNTQNMLCVNPPKFIEIYSVDC